jgi:formylglycine-generating enzyme required for sulfatase activity
MTLVQIPAGSFKMGSAESEVGRGAGEGPVHEVRISRPFWLGTHEVTNGQFRAFVQATGYQTDAEIAKPAGCLRFVVGTGQQVFDPKCNWQNPGWTAGDDLPVVCVSWRDANEFCKWLSTKEARTYRLPTEAEWEYACRAGSTTVFAFGNTLSSAEANFNGEQPYGHPSRGLFLGSVNKVGPYKPNAWGLYDMHGNVWEWCSDLFDPIYYLNSPSTDPRGPERGQSHVARGGSWTDSGAFCRSAMRGNGQPDYRTNFAGFRVARSP